MGERGAVKRGHWSVFRSPHDAFMKLIINTFFTERNKAYKKVRVLLCRILVFRDVRRMWEAEEETIAGKLAFKVFLKCLQVRIKFHDKMVLRHPELVESCKNAN